jgi:GTPase SAR1 family protein
LNYEEKKDKLLDKSKNLDKAINSVLGSDQNGLVIKSHHRDKIDELQKQSGTILEKLKKDEFEIAVVGQEDSGKSSLLNALIKTDIFPSASGRTTYTSTKLVAGSGDKVEVTLYTYNEFDEIFTNRLQAIGVKEELAKEKGFKNFSPNLSSYKNKHNSKIVEDLIKDIEKTISNRDEIIELLENKGGETLTFEGNALNDFKVFVKGDKSKKDFSKPRATKEITIYSSKLQAMPNSIIYDVPGFNSTTALHKEQTKKMLEEADSIIFISDSSSPDLKDDEAEILKQTEKDNFEVPLKDKIFVFGNKFDNANNKKVADDNKKLFFETFKNENIQISSERFFVGSAGKYLKDKNILNDKTEEIELKP